MKVLVDKKTYDKRITVCTSCDKFKKSTQRCGVCGCFMFVKSWLHTNIDGKLVQCPHPNGNKWILNETN